MNYHFTRAKCLLLTALISLSMIGITSPIVFGAAVSSNSVSSGSSLTVSPLVGNGRLLHPTQICALPGSNVSAGVYYSRTPDIKTTDPGVFLEDENNGNLYWCSIDNTGMTGNVTLIANPPAGAVGGGYFGLGGYETGPAVKGVVLVLTSYADHGMWFCYFATFQTCQSGESSFIPLPTSYCSTLATKTCNPYGTALDSSLNVYWVDPQNSVFSECTSASDYSNCFTLPFASALKGHNPTGLALVNNTAPYLSPAGWTFYITDSSCKGIVWEGNGTMSSPMVQIAQLGDSLQGIGTTTKDVGFTQQLVVGDTGTCHGRIARLVDLSNSTQKITTAFTGPSSIIGISVCWGQCLQNKSVSRQLFYTASASGTVWITKIKPD